MKTTSFEISKKLAEIGFKAEINFAFKEIDPSRHRFSVGFMSHCEGWFPSYDLETILEALPKTIERDNPFYLEFRKEFGGVMRMGYSEQNGLCDKVYPHFLKGKDESLADTAARLLILLHEKNLIQFKL